MKQIREPEIYGILLSPLIAYFSFTFSKDRVEDLFSALEGLPGILLSEILIPFIPAFIAIIAASALQSRRYRIVNALLSTFLIIILLTPFLAGISADMSGFMQACIYLAFTIIGTSTAIRLWKMADRLVSRNAPAAQPPPPDSWNSESPLFLSILAIVSIPIVFVDILASFFVSLGLASVAFLVMIRIPLVSIFAFAAAIALPFASLWSLLKSLYAVAYGKATLQPAIELERCAAPDFHSIIDEVARLIGVAPPDTVILHAEPNFFVSQGRIKLLEGKASGRTLAIGMSLIETLGGREFRSILAHEFAHFASGDLAYSSIVLPAYRALGSFINDFARRTQGDSFVDFNYILKMPTIRFLRDAYEYFATIDRAISRFREFRADRAAVELYGKDAFSSALMKTAERSRIIARIFGTIRPGREEALFKAIDATVMANSGAERPEESENPLDGHPSETTRIANVPDIPGSISGERESGIPSLEAEGRRLSSLAIGYYGIRLSSDEW